MCRRLLFLALFLAMGFVFASEAQAQYNFFDNCYIRQQRHQRAIYNAQVLAYKEHYTKGWVAGYRRVQGLSYERPVLYSRTDPRVRYYPPLPVHGSVVTRRY